MFGELQNHQRMIIRIYASTGLKVQLYLEGRASRVLRSERRACVIHAVGRRRVISPHKIADYIYSHFAAVLRSEMEPKWFSRRESARSTGGLAPAAICTRGISHPRRSDIYRSYRAHSQRVACRGERVAMTPMEQAIRRSKELPTRIYRRSLRYSPDYRYQLTRGEV